MTTKRVLITGATGLLGQYAIAPLLEAGYEVCAVSRLPRAIDRVVWFEGDLLDETRQGRIFAAARATHLLHLAWEMRPGRYMRDNSNYRWLSASLEMFRLFHEYGGKRIVGAGTVSEYAPGDDPLDEAASPLDDSTPYACCKAACGRLGASYCRNNGVSFGWGRVFFTYGKGEAPERLVASVARALADGRKAEVRSGPLVRDYMYAKDTALALVRFLDSGVEGMVNICSGRGVRIEELARILARVIGREDLLDFRADPGDQPPRVVGANGRLLREIGFAPRYGLEEGLRELIGEAHA